jgi:hypothetical protein
MKAREVASSEWSWRVIEREREREFQIGIESTDGEREETLERLG